MNEPALAPPASVVRILDDIVVNQIAAGEVVERPASVVKELVENSIDAGSTEITVSITNGGRSSIEVLDNGRGMSKDDALLAIERFGTSKIRSVDDLQSIQTHGFRGEALPSIAAVSRFQLSTAQQSGGVGVQIRIEGGVVRDVATLSHAPGTRIQVKQLFFNVPARRKFLRSENTEAGQVKALMVDFALAYPKIHFRLFIDGAESVNYAPGRSLVDRARELKLAGTKPLLCEETLMTASGEVSVEAVLSQPIECVVSSSRLRLLVNGRSVRDKLLLKAVRDGYGNFLRPGRYPMGVVSLRIPANEVDVNVHPQKTEVRFRRPEIIFAVLPKSIAKSLTDVPDYRGEMSIDERESLHSAISMQGMVASHGKIFGLENTGAPFGEMPGGNSRPLAQNAFSFSNQAKDESTLLPNWVTVEGDGEVSSSREVFNGNKFSPLEDLRQMRFVGQVFRCYLFLEGRGVVALVDMHAAHERVMFYRLKCQLLSGSIRAQMLLLPETVILPPERVQQFRFFQTNLEKLGIEADFISETSIVVRSVPALLQGVSAESIFRELLALPDWSDWGSFVNRMWDMAIARLACHRSIRSGRELEAPEVYELITALSEAEASGYCPHGRPIAKFFREQDFEAMFGRA